MILYCCIFIKQFSKLFWNSNQGPTDGCPREPWHDLHSQIDGPAAYDVLKNFQERWLNASKPRGLQKMKRSYDDHLLNLDKVPDVIGLQDAIRYSNDDRESWHVQVYLN